uniref:Uncharacterized protein n=1 Tax=Knipowitschia caucasica TaxID=637954 RepID=A0AAV2ME22_KNICA
MARHINRFDPRPGMPTDTQAYLREIDFYTDRMPNASPGDKIFLMRLTSNREVNNFIERQPRATRMDYNELCKALLAEYSDFGASGTLTAAMAVKHSQRACRLLLPQVKTGLLRQPELRRDGRR